ncbi:hypothetical protein AWC38_SpisGene22030 [Stylophora pistillata]|uniref:BACK domain-containing protein n=1 Tax=Stylophora pistillata TaxID=50429 RepID=A0A2B4R679_STYPI|nr:hypothetical protein AWC38_SpisGene22030 [Stylophora pistillata]
MRSVKVKKEADVYKIILDWVNQKRNERIATFEELFGYGRLGFLSRDCLEDVVTKELVRDTAVCLRLTLDATITMATFAGDDVPKSPRKGHYTRVIVARGDKYAFCYLPEEDLRMRLPDGLKDKAAHLTQMVSGSYSHLPFTKMQRGGSCFKRLVRVKLESRSCKGGSCLGEIHAVLKLTSTKLLRTGLMDPENSHTSGIHRLRQYHKCIHWLYSEAIENRLDKNKIVAIAIRREGLGDLTLETKWEEIIDLLEVGLNAFGVASQEKILAARGLRYG